MTWTQKFAALFGASYIMYRDNTWGFGVMRVYRRNGYYWRKTEKARSLAPIYKKTMAKDLHTLISEVAGPDGSIDQRNQWTPLTKTMKAWYVMLEDEPEST